MSRDVPGPAAERGEVPPAVPAPGLVLPRQDTRTEAGTTLHEGGRVVAGFIKLSSPTGLLWITIIE